MNQNLLTLCRQRKTLTPTDPEGFPPTEVPQPVHVHFRQNTGQSAFVPAATQTRGQVTSCSSPNTGRALASSVPLPAGSVGFAPRDLVLSDQDVTAATVKGPAAGTRLSAHHLRF